MDPPPWRAAIADDRWEIPEPIENAGEAGAFGHVSRDNQGWPWVSPVDGHPTIRAYLLAGFPVDGGQDQDAIDMGGRPNFPKVGAPPPFMSATLP
jgi:hypothetical protein